MLATEIRDLLGAAPERPSRPLVSIVVVNRDGADHLRRLLEGLIEHTDYPELELILVDNGSSDDSLDLVRSVQTPFPVSILANPHNESFSDANNLGAARAEGELLLFLNNDIEPFERGWLRELVTCLDAAADAGAVGSTLIYPDAESRSRGYAVQTQPFRLRAGRERLAIDPGGSRRELFDQRFGEDVASPSLIGACLLIEAGLFHRVGGFTHGYFYGAEDDDLCFKVREQGYDVLYSGRSFLIHHAGTTSRELLGEDGGPIRKANVRLLRSRWSARLWRECQLDRLAGGGLWAAGDGETSLPDPPSLEQVMVLGFCIRADRLPAERQNSVGALESELERRGHRCLALRDASPADPRAFLFDVVVHIRGGARYIPSPERLNVLWIVNRLDAVSAIECQRYDLVVTSSPGHAERLSADSLAIPVVALRDGHETADLIDSVLERAERLDLPLRIDARGSRSTAHETITRELPPTA